MRPHVFVLVSMLVLVGCTAEPEGPYVEFGRVRMYYEPDHPPCKGAPEYLDSVAARQAEFMGVTPPEKIIYNFQPSWDKDSCPPGAAGCAAHATSEIWSYLPDQSHELVHVMRKPSVSFFAEGEAVALGGPDRSGNPDYDVDIDQVIGQSRLGYEHYDFAGDFVSYLLSVHGAERFGEFLAKAPEGCAASVTRKAFAETYDQTIEEAITERHASGMVFDHSRLSFPECSAPPEPWQGDQWEVSQVIGCNESGTGPIDTHAIVDSAVTLHVPTAGFYRWSLEANAGSLQLRPCVGKSWWQYINLSTQGPPTGLGGRAPNVFIRLDAAQYYMHLRSQDDNTASMHAALAPTDAASSDCEPANAFLVPATSDGIYLAPDIEEQMLARVTVDRPRNGVTVVYQSELRICVDGCDTSNCPLLVSGDPFELAPGHTYTFVARSENRGRVAGLAFLN